MPAVAREQACVWGTARVVQLPATQTCSLHERDSVPLSSHTLLNPPHAPHAGQLEGPQGFESVSRVQTCVSTVSLGTHAPDVHEN